MRGIRNLKLTPEGDNLVLYGATGSGKSSVVDAIDFLLTGKIARLAGPGTAGITLAKHGRHVTPGPRGSFVRARVLLSDSSEAEFRRSFDAPGILACDPDPMPDAAREAIDLAKLGHHVLTRRDILQFITVEAATRAKQVQTLLDLERTEALREALVGADYQLRNRASQQNTELQAARQAVCRVVGIPELEAPALIEAVNKHRSILGGQPVESASSSTVRGDLSPPTVHRGSEHLNPKLLSQDGATIEGLAVGEQRDSFTAIDEALRSEIRMLRGDEAALTALHRYELSSRGLALLDDSGVCPLCGAKWLPADLQSHVRSEVSRASEARARKESIDAYAAALLTTMNAAREAIRPLRDAAGALALTQEKDALAKWLERVEEGVKSLSDPLEHYAPGNAEETLNAILEPPERASVAIATILRVAAAAVPEPSNAQTSWDTLTRLEADLQRVELAEGLFARAERVAAASTAVIGAFERSRNAVLANLYDAVRDRFVELYRILHPHEPDLAARIAPSGPGLDLLVAFHGHGLHPPHALHSEGHQDSMGLCLFLALAERLTDSAMQLTILDDVIMSVDNGHRRLVADLLSTQFASRQLILTTHDRTWMQQLRTEGVVRPANLIEFRNWALETGPHVNGIRDAWTDLLDHLSAGDVHSAAPKLRQTAEEFFGQVCDRLGARVPYRLSAQYELGDLAVAAWVEYRSLIKKAKSAANSWGKADEVVRLGELESVGAQVYARTHAEQWAVNSAVHYNEWEDLQPEDFRPVVDAFSDVFKVFTCQQCSTVLKVVYGGNREKTGVRCDCSQFSLNLVRKAG